jgi:hypothetical protein
LSLWTRENSKERQLIRTPAGYELKPVVEPRQGRTDRDDREHPVFFALDTSEVETTAASSPTFQSQSVEGNPHRLNFKN